MYEVEYFEVRNGERMGRVRRFPVKADADEFFFGMKRTGTPADSIKRNYPVGAHTMPEIRYTR